MEPVWESVEIPIIECIPNLSALITGEHIEIVFGKYICLLENGKSVLCIENKGVNDELNTDFQILFVFRSHGFLENCFTKWYEKTTRLLNITVEIR